jgi:hypothetical protein
MSTLEAEKDTTDTVETREVVEIIDCGPASERTRGFANLILFELGIPPMITLLF